MSNWTQQRELHERIRWARIHAGYEKAKLAADALNINPITYRSYERAKADNGREPPLSEIQRFAKKFRVSWHWLAAGEGVPMVDDMPPSIYGVWASIPEEKREDAVKLWEALGKTGTRG